MFLLRLYCLNCIANPRINNSLRNYIKHSKECFLLFPNTSKLVKKNLAAPRFSNLLLGVWKSEETLFLVFDILLELYISSAENVLNHKLVFLLIEGDHIAEFR